MVGMAVDVARGFAPLWLMPLSLDELNMMVPLAPPDGLFLHTCEFERYNARYAETHSPINVHEGAATTAMERFKEQFIWGHIARQCARQRPYEQWVRELDRRSSGIRWYRIEKHGLDLRKNLGHTSKEAIEVALFRNFTRMMREKHHGMGH